MPKVHKTIEDAGRNLDQATAFIPGRYGASTARASWATEAASPQARDNYAAGISEAIAAGRRETRISAVGDAKWRKGCKEKGEAVIGGRIKAAIPYYKAQFGGVLSAMNAASDAAPARTRDFRANIANRLFPVVEAAKAASPKR